MKKFLLVLATLVVCSGFALADTSHASLTLVRRHAHKTHRHHAHKAARHHTPKHRRAV
ncbi:MAG TPA: hypothetical protein VMD76_14020 [Candidatus Sulfotelmatobacter sp.]|nr:hypothetical protein [Candidatus Sulfotelmatobacter sp.]